VCFRRRGLTDAGRPRRCANVRRVGYKREMDLHLTAVNVDCTDYYAQLASDKAVQAADEPKGFSGAQSHSWYFGNAVFTRDVFDTVIGIENGQRTTRVVGDDGKFHLGSK
jgi:hypothetical protein